MKKEENMKRFSLKDQLFNKEKVAYLAELFYNVEKTFDKDGFQKDIVNKFPQLELKERILWIRDNLKKYLDQITKGDYQKNIKIILKALPRELDNKKSDDDFGDFIFAPMGYFVAHYGLDKKDLEVSFEALSEITKRFSAEDPVRFFINKFPEETFSFMEKMSLSDNYHQRRLSSEGLRPKLPWCIALDFDYKKGALLLNNLFHDKTRYVTRSVANHLNDISKIDSNFTINALKRWKATGKQKDEEMDFIIKHSLRTLVKKGNKEALSLLGFSANPKIKVQKVIIKEKKLFISKMKNSMEKYDKIKKEGQSLEFSFDIYSENIINQNLLIDYKIFFMTKSGKKSLKVFKLKKIVLKDKEKIKISKKHPFRIMSTKKLYSGEHILEIQINGKIFAQKSFILA